MSQEIPELEIELLYCEAKLECSKADIKKFEIEIEILKQKISNNKSSKRSERNVCYTDDGETMFIKSDDNILKEKEVYYTDDGETMFIKSKKDLSLNLEEEIGQINTNNKIMIQKSELINSNNDLTSNVEVDPSTIKEHDMEERGIPFKFLLEDTIVSLIREKFVEDDSPLNDPAPEWTIEKLYEELDNKKMTIERLEDLLDIKIEYNYGDFINFDDYRYGNMFIVGKNGILYRNPDTSCLGEISIPFEISKYLYDSIDKYSHVASDIELGYKEDKLDEYSINFKNIYDHKFIWSVNEGIFVEGEEEYTKILLEKKVFKILKNQKKAVDNKKFDINSIKGKIVVFTGGKDKSLLTLFEEFNITVGSSVTKNTSLLIAKDKNELSTKILKAKELNIPIYSLEDFKKELS